MAPNCWRSLGFSEEVTWLMAGWPMMSPQKWARAPRAKAYSLGVVESRMRAVTKLVGADVVEEVGEVVGAEGIVADVLDDGAAVGVGVGFADLVGGDAGKAGAEHGDDGVFPGHVDDFFVGQDGVGVRGSRKERGEQKEQKCFGAGVQSHTAGLTIQRPDGAVDGTDGGGRLSKWERRGRQEEPTLSAGSSWTLDVWVLRLLRLRTQRLLFPWLRGALSVLRRRRWSIDRPGWSRWGTFFRCRVEGRRE